MNTYIGIDLGGTKLLIGEVTEAGEVLRSRSYPTGALTQQQAMELICKALDDFLPGSENTVRALGYTQAHPLRYVTSGIHLTTLDPRTIGLLGAASNAIIGMEEAI